MNSLQLISYYAAGEVRRSAAKWSSSRGSERLAKIAVLAADFARTQVLDEHDYGCDVGSGVCTTIPSPPSRFTTTTVKGLKCVLEINPLGGVVVAPSHQNIYKTSAVYSTLRDPSEPGQKLIQIMASNSAARAYGRSSNAGSDVPAYVDF